MPDIALCGFWPHATAEAAALLPAGSFAVLPETAEPDDLRPARNPPHVITVVPADLLLDGLTDDRPPLPADTRSIGALVARQIEQADTVLLIGEDQHELDDWEAEQLRVLLRRLAPWAAHRTPADPHPSAPGRATPLDQLTRGLTGRPVGVHEPVPDHGVTACLFQARRPFHPARLYDALDQITDRVLRSRGHFWLASRPDLALTWEFAGGLSLGQAGGWLADLPPERWDTVDPERRLAADLGWDPYYGDRHHHLAFVGVDLDAVALHRTLAACLLTDAELSEGEEGRRRLPDPFTRSFSPAEGV